MTGIATTALPVEDQLAIQQLVAQYAFRCDTARYTEVSELLTEDGLWDESILGMPICEGRDRIHELFCSIAPLVGYLIHIGSNHQFTEFSGDTAAATAHLLCECEFRGSEVRIRGYYSDRYVKTDGHWRFAYRKLHEIAPTVGLPAE